MSLIDDEEKKNVFPALYIIMTLRILLLHFGFVCKSSSVYESDKNLVLGLCSRARQVFTKKKQQTNKKLPKLHT